MTYSQKQAKSNDEVIRKLSKWEWTGNVAKKPGAGFKRPFDFIRAVHRVGEMARKYRDLERAFEKARRRQTK